MGLKYTDVRSLEANLQSTREQFSNLAVVAEQLLQSKNLKQFLNSLEALKGEVEHSQATLRNMSEGIH